MKEKRYFCDWIFDKFDTINKWLILILIPLILLMIIFSTFTVCSSYNNYKKEVLSYSEEDIEADYEYLTELTNIIYDESTNSIKLFSIPKDVIYHNHEFSNDKIRFCLLIDKNLKYIYNPSIEVEISKNSTIPKIDYLDKTTVTSPIMVILDSISLGIAFGAIAWAIPMFIFLTSMKISSAKKHAN